MSVVAKRLSGSRIKMPLGMEINLGQGDIVLDGDPAPLPPKKRTQQPPPHFSLYLGVQDYVGAVQLLSDLAKQLSRKIFRLGAVQLIRTN